MVLDTWHGKRCNEVQQRDGLWKGPGRGVRRSRRSLRCRLSYRIVLVRHGDGRVSQHYMTQFKGRTYNMWHAPSSAVCTLAVVALMLVVTGCGESHSRGGSGKSTYAVKYLPGDLVTLVRRRFAGGYVSIIAEQYEYGGKVYSQLANHAETVGEHGRRRGEGGSGPSLGHAEGRPIDIDISYGCVGRYEYTLAYGLLRDPKSTVTARRYKATITFTKVAIPATFHPGGVLVYALLGPGALDVTTRTPDGRTVTVEHYAEGRAICHRG
jgi:hypothetical protein